MTNAEIAAVFEEMAQLLEFQAANPFRIRAYRNASRTIASLDEPLSEIAATDGRHLTDIEGVGADLGGKIQTLLDTGELPAHQDLLKQTPPQATLLLRVPGLGPKRAALLYKELDIKSIDDLRRACQEHRVQKIKGFGPKIETEILNGLDLAEESQKRILWSIADEYVQAVLAHLQGVPGVERLEVAGSYRRGRETVGDLDFLAVAVDAKPVMDRLAELSDIEKVLLRGDTKMSVRLKGGLQLDLRVIAAESFGAALQYFTGSQQHNVMVRRMAQDRGLKVNEYGVFRGQDRIAGATEQEVYAAVDLPWFPPEVREARQEFEWAEAKRLPKLIELSDLQADLHMHTTATDGTATLDEMVTAAQQLGLKYLAITDHSKRVTMANGLNAKRLREQWKQIDRLNEKLAGKFLILKGIECDILEGGGMDLDDDVLAEADWVIASIHYGQKQPKERITKRIVDAIRHPSVSVIAHPTGRLINERPPYNVELTEVIKAAADHRKCLELNASPARLDLNDVHCAMAKRHGVPIIISSDAHSIQGLKALRHGILQARRAGLTAADVGNTSSWEDLRRRIGTDCS